MTNLKQRVIVGITATALAVPGAFALATSASAADTLTEQQITTLQAMAAEEKLAGDLYDALAAAYPDRTVFTRVGASEDKHLAKLRELLASYGITDPTAGDAAGYFDDAAVQQLYTDLVAQGSESIAAAANAGQAIETRDITDLDAALALAYPADVDNVFKHLKAASARHLDEFNYLEANPTATDSVHQGGQHRDSQRKGRTGERAHKKNLQVKSSKARQAKAKDLKARNGKRQGAQLGFGGNR